MHFIAKETRGVSVFEKLNENILNVIYEYIK